MKPNDKAYQAAILAIKENGPYYAGSKIRESMAKHLAEVALPAAYAAQFQSEEYAVLIRELRMRPHRRGYETEDEAKVRRQKEREEAADALEALLAERDALKAELAKAQEIARVQAERIGGYIKTIEDHDAERDALLARLAPADDEALVGTAANAICVFVYASPDNKTEFHGQARAAIAAIRPHIEAAERERCAAALEITSDEIRLHAGEMTAQEMRSVLAVLAWRAAAIRSGK